MTLEAGDRDKDSLVDWPISHYPLLPHKLCGGRCGVRVTEAPGPRPVYPHHRREWSREDW